LRDEDTSFHRSTTYVVLN